MSGLAINYASRLAGAYLLSVAAAVAIVIPLSLLATFIGLNIKGIPANLLSLGAMDFGIIVDGAVVIVEKRCAITKVVRPCISRPSA